LRCQEKSRPPVAEDQEESIKNNKNEGIPIESTRKKGPKEDRQVFKKKLKAGGGILFYWRRGETWRTSRRKKKKKGKPRFIEEGAPIESNLGKSGAHLLRGQERKRMEGTMLANQMKVRKGPLRARGTRVKK